MAVTDTATALQPKKKHKPHPNAIDGPPEHPQREKIFKALIDGKSPAQIEVWCNPKVNRVTLWRYWCKIVKPVLERADESAKLLGRNQEVSTKFTHADISSDVKDATIQALKDDPIVSRVFELQAERKRIKDLAEAGGDLRAWSSLDGNDLRSVELHAKLVGRLKESTTNNTQVLILPQAAQQHSDEADPIIIDMPVKRS